MTAARRPRSRARSAGILLYRRAAGGLEVLLVHPGGPFWARRDLGAWSIPKGEYADGESGLDAARREFQEELGSPPPDGEFLDLGEVRQKSGKVVRAWAVAGDLDADADHQQRVRDGVAAAVGPDPDVPGGRPGAVVRSGAGAREDQLRPGCAARSTPGDCRPVSASDAISPTAHYTGQVWLRNGLSHPRLGTPEGRVLFDALHPVMLVSGAVGGPSLEPYLLARHRAIDALLERAIEDHGVGQVVEVAAGLSPRGWRFTPALRRPHHLRRGRPAGDGRPQAAGAVADAARWGTTTGWWISTRCATRGRAVWPRWPASLTTSRGWPSSPRGCSATWIPTP